MDLSPPLNPHVPDEFDLLADDATLDLMGTGWDVVDWVIDFSSVYALLNLITYNVSVIHDLDGLYTGLETIPEKAMERAGSILWVLMTSGMFHRVRITADATTVFGDNNEPLGEQFHIRLLEATMYYQGQLA